MDRDAKQYLKWWIIAALVIAVLNMVGCAKPRIESPAPKDGVVVVAPVVENNLDFLYFAIAERGKLEAWFCLQGYNDTVRRNVLISGVVPVWVDSADDSNIVGRPAGCPRGSVGTVHFHPVGNYCALSSIDVNTAHYLPYEISAVVCKDGTRPRMVIVRRKQFDETWNALPWDNSPARIFTPVYRYIPP